MIKSFLAPLECVTEATTFILYKGEIKVMKYTDELKDKIPFLFRGRGNKEFGDIIGYVADVVTGVEIDDKEHTVVYIRPIEDNGLYCSIVYPLENVDPCYGTDNEGNLIFKNDIITIYEKDFYRDKPTVYMRCKIHNLAFHGLELEDIKDRGKNYPDYLRYYDWNEFNDNSDSDLSYYFIKEQENK